jgi:MFS superfamily sulfate permease-like transporter
MNNASSVSQNPASRWRLPLFQGILPFDKSHLLPDILAGITLAALGIPEVMGYTKIIGTPVHTGLYTMLLPMLAFALFGSSRHLVVSADSATAAMVAAALTAMSFVANTPQYVALTSLIALEAAAILLAARILRLGFLADFLSRTVLVGFLSGVGIQVAFGELHGMLGLEKGGHGFLGHLVFLAQHISETQLPYLFISLAVLVVIVGFEKFAPRFPGALLAVIGMIAASTYFHWSEHGIQVVGEVPSGLPRLGLPDVTWANVQMVLPISLSCFIVILAQSAATSRAYALRFRDQFSQNVDLVGLSFANAAAGCSGTFIVNGSPTKTAMVDTGGGRSQISHLATVTMVLLVLLFLTKPLAALPNAVLAAIVFMIGVKLFDHRGLAEICHKKPMEFAVAVATAAVVVLVGVEQGIVFALIVSLLQFVRRSYQPSTFIIMRDDKDEWRMDPVVPGKMVEPGLVLYWFGAELFYANAGHFVSEVRWLVSKSPTPVKWFVIDASAITAIDFSAGKALKELQQDLAKEGVTLAISRLQLRRNGHLESMGLLEVIGTNHIFISRHDCIEAYRSEMESQSEPAG